MSFIDLFEKELHSSVCVPLTRLVLGGNGQRLSCLSANIVASTLNSVEHARYEGTCLLGEERVAFNKERES